MSLESDISLLLAKLFTDVELKLSITADALSLYMLFFFSGTLISYYLLVSKDLDIFLKLESVNYFLCIDF